MSSKIAFATTALLVLVCPALARSAAAPQGAAGSRPQPAASSALDAAPAQPRTNAGERIELPASDDKRTVVASFWAPKQAAGQQAGQTAPGVVLVHQPGGKRDDLVEVATRLHKQGFAVLAIDLRAHGESVGKDKPWEQLNEEERTRTWAFALRDLRGAATWLGKQTGVHSSNVSLLGDRAGCTLVVRHATRDENVRALVLLDPPREQLGFNLAKDVEVLAGLPTLIAASKDTQGSAQAIADDGAKANDGLKYVEVAVFKGVAPITPPEFDKALTAQIAKFLADKALPKKAK
ncbi:MAG: dienelactone hydrolase family protein [Planctomycetes bacterium]|nr:dienelactone hydrolase family protein [Planctomycetota bacterium]